jgi:hypothetical protein
MADVLLLSIFSHVVAEWHAEKVTAKWPEDRISYLPPFVAPGVNVVGLNRRGRVAVEPDRSHMTPELRDSHFDRASPEDPRGLEVNGLDGNGLLGHGAGPFLKDKPGRNQHTHSIVARLDTEQPP